ncbi:MAG: pitrilysin family protein [Thermoflexus sp.]|nr:pitrilysin family protein [Thermoflexus sp.]MDT7883564.1 pitrilysin family protein [Thermoflexus sp.]MDT7946962.1 pitrilysin family protein [Thermoflexus sp.]
MARRAPAFPVPSRSRRRPRPVRRDGFLKTSLDNGLTVVLKEQHHAPVVTFWIWYRVGSRDEPTGLTGISHWVEHMLFKGTPTYPKGTLDRLISREGGAWNGMTWLDFTTYFETLPSDRWTIAPEIEADRMTKALFHPKEVEAERTVILSERHGYENNPLFLLSEQVQALAFQAHPYGHEVIGWPGDLQTMTREDLYRHYRTYYAPNNAVVVAVGDFRIPEALRVIERAFGRIRPVPEIPRLRVQEPPPRGERRTVLEGEGNTAYLEIAYLIPEATHPDFLPLVVLNAVFTGTGSLSFSGGTSNKTSRLYRALVERGIAADIEGSLIPTVEPFLYRLTATLQPGRHPQEAEAVIDAEIDRLQTEPLRPEEFEKALKQARADFAYSSESVTNQGFWYGWSEIFADYTWFEGYLDRLKQVTPEDVQRVARAYLVRSRRTVGWYLPTRRAAS